MLYCREVAITIAQKNPTFNRRRNPDFDQKIGRIRLFAASPVNPSLGSWALTFLGSKKG